MLRGALGGWWWWYERLRPPPPVLPLLLLLLQSRGRPFKFPQSKEAPSALCLQLLTCLRSMWSLLCPSLTRENLGGA